MRTSSPRTQPTMFINFRAEELVPTRPAICIATVRWSIDPPGPEGFTNRISLERSDSMQLRGRVAHRLRS